MMASIQSIHRAESEPDRADCWRIREAVFLGEQSVPLDVEQDGLDARACHLLARLDGRAVGTTRLLALDGRRAVLPWSDASAARVVKIGRMAVLPELRRRGIGSALLEAALDETADLGIVTVELSAQQHALGFYTKAGFRAEGDSYEEAGIPHRRMTLALPSRTEVVSLFERRRDAWLQGDLDAYLALWSEDMTFQSPVHAEPLRGREAFALLVRQSFDFARPVRFEFHGIAVHARRVLAEWTIAIERRGDGRIVGWRGMSVAEVRDGLLHQWREYWNPSDLL